MRKSSIDFVQFPQPLPVPSAPEFLVDDQWVADGQDVQTGKETNNDIVECDTSESLLDHLIALRQKEADLIRIQTSRRTLESFCSNELDASRLLIQYWSRRIKLIERCYEATEEGELPVDQMIYAEERDLLDNELQEKIAAGLEQARMNGRAIELSCNELLESTDQFMEQLQQGRRASCDQQRELLDKAAALSINGVDAVLSGLRWGDDEINAMCASKQVQIQQRIVNDGLVVQEEAQNFSNIESSEPSTASSHQLKKDLAAHVAMGVHHFHSKFVESSSRCAKLALQALDRQNVCRHRVVSRSKCITSEQFNVEESLRQDVCAEALRRRIVLSFENDAAARMEKTQQRIAKQKTRRLEFLQECAAQISASLQGID